MKSRFEIKGSLPRPPLGTSRSVSRGKVTVNYFVSGSGETVVLLPAFARAASDYNELAGWLNTAGYRTAAVELRGMGKSRSPVFPRATMHNFATDVASVIGDLDDLVGGKVHVLGRAFGARVARTLAADYPKVVQSVILLAGVGVIKIAKARLLRYAIYNLPFMPEKWRLRAIGATLYAPGNKVPPHLAYRQTFRAVCRQFGALRRPREEIWPQRNTPILWIRGEQDALVRPGNTETIRERFSDQLKPVVIPNAGHALIPEQPEAILREIMIFLKKHTVT